MKMSLLSRATHGPFTCTMAPFHVSGLFSGALSWYRPLLCALVPDLRLGVAL